jgi:hypothetical protein
MDYNFNNPTSAASFQNRLENMIKMLKGKFKEYVRFNKYISNIKFICSSWKRFFIFLTTHSDPRNGFLHIGPNNCGSAPASEVIFFTSISKMKYANFEFSSWRRFFLLHSRRF